MKNIKNEWYKIYKGKRLAIFLMILFVKKVKFLKFMIMLKKFIII